MYSITCREKPANFARRDGHGAVSERDTGEDARSSADLSSAFAAMTVDGSEPGRVVSARLDAADITGAGAA
jgi:hypothetical protein